MNNFKKKIEKKIIKITNFSYINFFGRANTAIWAITLFLKKNNKKRSIILPASMCVSPAIIFLINGFKLIFVDVDKNTGLLDIKKVSKIIKKDNDICGLFYVNLFGNTEDLSSQINKIKKKNIVVIQDLAQTFLYPTKKINNKLIGDFIILSFGYSKIFDLNHGGMVLSNDSYFRHFGEKFDEGLKKININYKTKNKYIKWYEQFFIKNQKFMVKDLKVFAKELYLIKFNVKIFKKIYLSITSLAKESSKRSKLLKDYIKIFTKLDVHILHSKSTMIPWRFSFLANTKKEIILDKLRKKNFDASSYYPNIAKRFDKSKKKFNNADKIEKKIINLWLTNKYNKKKILDQVNIVK